MKYRWRIGHGHMKSIRNIYTHQSINAYTKVLLISHTELSKITMICRYELFIKDYPASH